MRFAAKMLAAAAGGALAGFLASLGALIVIDRMARPEPLQTAWWNTTGTENTGTVVWS